jgi:hypothetical protein
MHREGALHDDLRLDSEGFGWFLGARLLLVASGLFVM